jgi:hypothetical protein
LAISASLAVSANRSTAVGTGTATSAVADAAPTVGDLDW